MKVIEKVLTKLCEIMNYFSALSIFIMMGLIVVDVILRSVFKIPIIGATEIVQLLIVLEMASLGLSIILERQICVSAVVEHFPPRVQLVVEIFVELITLFVFVMTSYAQFRQVGYSKAKGMGYHFIKVPYWPFILLFGIAFAVGAIAVILMIIRKFRALITGDWEDEILYTEKKRQELIAIKEQAAALANAGEFGPGDTVEKEGDNNES